MALNTYLAATQRLLQNPPATNNLYSTTDLTSYINTARGQIAGEGMCVHVMGTLALANGARTANFTSVTLPAGVSSVLNVRQLTYGVGSGGLYITGRPFPYFNFYYLNNPVPSPGAPAEWAQFAQGTSGSLYFEPVADSDYVLNVDCICLPASLASDSDPEVVPYPWTDAIPYYAAYMANLSSQRAADADKMFATYNEFMKRARAMANPTVLGGQYLQAVDPTMQNKLGLSPNRGQ